MAKMAKTTNSATYINLVGATNYYNNVLATLNSLQVNPNIKPATLTKLINNIFWATPQWLNYAPQITESNNLLIIDISYECGAVGNIPDIGLSINLTLNINKQGFVSVTNLQMVYECSHAPAFISNVLQIPYGGYLNTVFNNAPVQIVNYASEGFWQIGIGNN